MASPKVWWPSCSLSRMRLHVWCRALNGMTTSLQCYSSCTGIWFDIGWISRWPSCSIPVNIQHGSSMATDCQLVSDEGCLQLHSATSRMYAVRRTYSNYGDRCFVVACPKLWNSLPADLRQSDINLQRCKQLPKIFLFGWWDRGALWLTVEAALHKFSD